MPTPLIITDAAVNIAPTLEDKVDIVQNAIDLAHAMGVAGGARGDPERHGDRQPQGALDDRGRGAVQDGRSRPDHRRRCSTVRWRSTTRSAPRPRRSRSIVSPVAGRANVLVVPDLEAGNMLAKSLSFLAGADAAGIVLGARVPIILTSRADSLLTPAGVLRRRGAGGRRAARQRRRRHRLRTAMSETHPPGPDRPQGAGRRHRQRPVDRLWLRQGVPRGRRRARRSPG